MGCLTAAGKKRHVLRLILARLYSWLFVIKLRIIYDICFMLLYMFHKMFRFY